MLVNLSEILKIAESEKKAILSFNTPNLETLRAVIDAAEYLNQPVIIMHAQVHEYAAPIDIIGPIMIEHAKRSSVKVCVHLDHGEDYDYVVKAINLGFSSVMYDGSALPKEENIRNTLKITELAHKLNVSVEGEIGALQGREAGDTSEVKKAVYTDPAEALEFVTRTHIDALACSFGTAHGFYTAAPKLDFERINNISKLTNVPLVMHGGSGVSIEDFHQSIELGVRKINYYSYLSKAGTEAAKKSIESGYLFYHDVALEAYKAMKEHVINAMKNINK